MNSEEILEAIRSEIGDTVAAAEHAIARRARRIYLLVGLCVCCLTSAVVSTAILVSTRREVVAEPPIAQIVAGIRNLPTGSPELACFARALISCSASLSGDALVASLSSVGRAGLGLEAEPFVREALLSASTSVRREAVIWYPVVHPGWQSDPVGGPIYEQARQSLSGN